MIGVEEIIKKISATKKYRGIDNSLVGRIVTDLSGRYKIKEVEEKTRNTLHQIWGEFSDPNIDYEKLLKDVEKLERDNGDKRELAQRLLLLHASTKERAGETDFYSKIFKVTGAPKSVWDIGCGFSPIFWGLYGTNAEYLGTDLDSRQVDFLNQSTKILFPTTNITVKQSDILGKDKFEAEMVMMLKLLPVLEKQEKGISKRLLSELKASWIIVSFPSGSLSGKKQEMGIFYDKWFSDLCLEMEFETQKISFHGEILWILKKGKRI